jgi:hypothetical protein
MLLDFEEFEHHRGPSSEIGQWSQPLTTRANTFGASLQRIRWVPVPRPTGKWRMGGWGT